MEGHENDEAARVAAMVTQHHETLLRIAGRVSLCPDDAHDAVQRALEIYLRRLATLDPKTELAWLKVVVRNEALAVRKGRGAAEPLDPEVHVSLGREPDDHAVSAERAARSGEALARLKPDEARGLLAASLGLSYREIGAQFQWSYTKTNRVITEGRARFLELFGRLERGEECERFAPDLQALAEGRGGSEEVVGLRPHLRRCSSCRATVRGLHGARRSRMVAAIVLPWRGLADRLTQAKSEAYGAAARMSDLAASAPAGGGRGAAATALVGLCLGGAGSYCAATGVFDGPQREPERQVAIEPQRRPPAPPPQPVAERTPVPRVTAPATAAGAPARQAARPPRSARPVTPPPRKAAPPRPEPARDDPEFAVAESQPAPPREFSSASSEPAPPAPPAADFERQPSASTAAEFGG